MNFPIYWNWKEEAWKNQGFNGIQTHDLCDTGAMLYQLSYEATHWERGQFIEFIYPVRSEMQLVTKFKQILYMELRTTLNFRKVKVALNPIHVLMYRIVLNFAESYILSCL